MYHLQVLISKSEMVDIGDFGVVPGRQQTLAKLNVDSEKPADLARLLDAVGQSLYDWQA